MLGASPTWARTSFTHLSQDLLHCGTRVKVHMLCAPGPQPIPTTSCHPWGRLTSLLSHNCVYRALSSATVSLLPTHSLCSWCHRGSTAWFANSQGKFRRAFFGEGSHFLTPSPSLAVTTCIMTLIGIFSEINFLLAKFPTSGIKALCYMKPCGRQQNILSWVTSLSPSRLEMKAVLTGSTSSSMGSSTRQLMPTVWKGSGQMCHI